MPSMPEGFVWGGQEAQASVSRLKAEQAVLAETRSNCQAQLGSDRTAAASAAAPAAAAAAGEGNDPTTCLEDRVGIPGCDSLC